jgi:hypothetical protein
LCGINVKRQTALVSGQSELSLELVRRVGQYPQMPAAASGTMLGWREQSTARGGCLRTHVVKVRVREAVQRGPACTRARQAAVAGAALAHRVRQCDQVILVGIGG